VDTISTYAKTLRLRVEKTVCGDSENLVGGRKGPCQSRRQKRKSQTPPPTHHEREANWEILIMIVFETNWLRMVV
jgi:hypothetical protein